MTIEETESLPLHVGPEEIAKLQQTLTDSSLPMAQRYRCIFTLKSLGGVPGGEGALEALIAGLQDSSALLKHEIAYVLGQMGDKRAVPTLERLVRDREEDYMVRHEAGEALGALSAHEAEETLRFGAADPCPEVAETCQLALGRLQWERTHGPVGRGKSGTVDPTPPFTREELGYLPSLPSSEWVNVLSALLRDDQVDLVSIQFNNLQGV